jgi:hypothetical protein
MLLSINSQVPQRIHQLVNNITVWINLPFTFVGGGGGGGETVQLDPL